MKSITYYLIAAIATITLLSAIPKSTPKTTKKEVTLQCLETSPDAAKINQSAKIIENRLTKMGVEKYKIEVLKTGTQIKVTFDNDNDFLLTKDLLTSLGDIQLYETIERKEKIDKLGFEDKLFSILNIPASVRQNKIISSEATLGYCKTINKAKVDDYLSKAIAANPDDDIKYTWSKYSAQETEYWLLYLLKKSSVLNHHHIDKSNAFVDSTNTTTIQLNFNQEGSAIWKKVSENNIGKSIVIVTNDFVFAAPKIMSVIENGQCTITGSFSIDEAKLLVNLLSNGELPLKFKLIE